MDPNKVRGTNGTTFPDRVHTLPFRLLRDGDAGGKKMHEFAFGYDLENCIAETKPYQIEARTHTPALRRRKRLNEKHLLSLTYTTILISHTLNTDTYGTVKVLGKKNNVLCARTKYYFSASIWKESTRARIGEWMEPLAHIPSRV